MKSGEKKSFLSMPKFGLIEAGSTMEETMLRVRKAEVKKELAAEKMRKKLERENPGCEIIKNFHGQWIVVKDE